MISLRGGIIIKYGFTTGSCAAAGSKAAAYMLLSGNVKNEITINTPKGIAYKAAIEDIKRSPSQVSCAVRKDGGDDPDITTGALVYSKVTIVTSSSVNDGPVITIDGGVGVGRVTKPGLDQPVGNAAINHVPREMIRDEVLEVCKLYDFMGELSVEISVPGGVKLAAQTFNPRLGIEGGISILGTSGIVEPMSNQAIVDTIRVQLNQRRALGFDYVAVTPGNYGQEYMKKTYGYDLDRSVKCSNFIGMTIDMAAELGFKSMLFTGHIGKLIKLAGGIMNTHSREADCRMELLSAFAIRYGLEQEKVLKLQDCLTTEEAIGILKEAGILNQVMNYAMERIVYYVNKRSKDMLKIDCIMYSNEYGELANSLEDKGWFTLLEQEQGQ